MPYRDLNEQEENYPETVDWNRLSSLALTLVAVQICAEITIALKSPDQDMVPGLRRALLIFEARNRPRR